MPYGPDQMFELVADVGRYPEFLPWCRGARVRERTDTLVVADLIVGFKGITERFTSRVSLDRANRSIDVEYQDGPFKYLENHWEFHEREGGCLVDFYVDFEFRSRFLQTMIGAVFTEAVRRMVNAFEARARQLYG
nr:type II toxin-antitoxin system RatA family toxin [Marivibrio halodurans]